MNKKIIGYYDPYGHNDDDGEGRTFFIPVAICPICQYGEAGTGFDVCPNCHTKIDEWREEK